MRAAKLLSLLVAVALIVSLTGCGVGGSKDNTSSAGASDGVYEADTTFNFTSGGITAQGGNEGYEIDGSTLTIKELTLDIKAPVNDAINAQQLLNLESGSITVSAGDDAVHCDLIMNVGAQDTDGPTITVTQCSEGLEAAQLNIISGSIDIISSDDCLNAANSDLSDYDFSINISGGSISAYSTDGDGFDSNGDLNISGGTVAVWTASRADDQPLDADGTVTVSGGTVFAAGGSSGMGLSLSAQQPCVTFASDSGAAGLAKSGAQVSVKTSDGKELFSSDAPCDAAFVFFSAAELSDGEDADLYSGTDEVATAAVQSGSVSVGNAGGMGGMRPGGSPGNAGAEPPQGGAKPDGEPPQGGRPGNK